MKEGLLDIIRSAGYWRINIRPNRIPAKAMLLGDCRDIVKRASVSIRGWDFPHINLRNDTDGGYSTEDTYFENWTHWNGFNEFWRMYASSQFLSYVALREDTKPSEHGNPKLPVLNTIGTVYQITETLEFCHRLFENGLYEVGAVLKLSLVNSRGRVLTPGPYRIPFFDQKMSNSERIDLSIDLSADQLHEGYLDAAIELCVRLFDKFGWNPDPTQIKADQERFLRRDFQY
jgi:hypothetical protein